LWMQGKMEAVRDHLCRVEELAGALRDERRTGAAVTGLLNFYWITGRPEETRRYVDAVKEVNGRLSDPALRATSATNLSQVLEFWGDYEEARRTAEWGLEVVPDSLERRRTGAGGFGFPGVMLRAMICLTSAELGDFARAVETGQQALRLAERLDHPFTLLFSQVGVCYCHLERGELEEVLAIAESACALARERAVTNFLSQTLALAGHAKTVLGRAPEGRALLEEARAVADASPFWNQRCRIGVYLGEAHVRLGEVEQGRQCLEGALNLARSLGQRGVEARALAALGDAHATGSTDEALARYREALALAAELRMRPLVARCDLGLGRLYRRTGQHEQALERLTTAVTMFREMDMRFWLRQAEAEMRA
jgi:tetratricopeptide (TPR) repeat protein